jgi:hypothetical protein
MKKIILFLFIAFALGSCKNLVPFTDAMKQEHNWTTDQLKAVQFYLSHDVILRRELTKGTSEIVHGKIKMVDGRKVDEILVRAGTPGLLTDMPKEGKALVSFEVGDDHYLSFGVNPKKGDKFVLLASEWNNGMGKVHYAGDEYYTDPDSRFAFLMVDMHKINNMSLKEHVAKGRKVQ